MANSIVFSGSPGRPYTSSVRVGSAAVGRVNARNGPARSTGGIVSKTWLVGGNGAVVAVTTASSGPNVGRDAMLRRKSGVVALLSSPYSTRSCETRTVQVDAMAGPIVPTSVPVVAPGATR